LRFVPENSNWFAIPYIGEATYRIGKFLRKKLQCQLGYFTGRNLSTFFMKHKDKLKTDKIQCGVYSINCSKCEKIYIGETGRDISTRINEHLNHCRNSNAHLSALASHLSENTGHTPNISSVQIADKETRKDFRKIKEAAYIRKYKTKVMNNNEGIKCSSMLLSTIVPLVKNKGKQWEFV